MSCQLTTQQQNVAPSWGNYLYQNVLPNIPTDWLMNANLGSSPSANGTTTTTTTTGNSATAQSAIFNTDPNAAWSGAMATPTSQMSMGSQPGPSSYYMNFYSGSIAPSLLAPSTSSNGSGTPSTHISPSIDMVDKIVASPSPLSVGGSPPSMHHMRMASINMGGRMHTFDSADPYDHEGGDSRSQHSHPSEHDHESPNEHEHDEGVERDGMIWGMKVDEYRALSARERKRVRNRISARTFRAKRKEHLNSLESTLGAKDLEIKLLHEENLRLRRELGEMKRRMGHFDAKPY